MHLRARKLAATSAALLALGGMGAGASLGLAAAKTTHKTTTRNVGQFCAKLGAVSKAKNGKSLTCKKVGKKLRWEVTKKKG